MGDERPRIHVTAAFRGLAASEEDVLVQFLARYKAKLVRRANRSLHKRMIDGADLDGEGAVDLAIARIWRLRRRGILDATRASEDLFKLMLLEVSWLIRNEKKRSEVAKRGGQSGAAATVAAGRHEVKVELGEVTRTRRHRIEFDLDQLVSGDSPVEDVVVNKLEFEAFLVRLSDDSHRTIIKMRCDGYPIVEIARSLGVARRTIQRKLTKIMDVYLKYHADS